MSLIGQCFYRVAATRVGRHAARSGMTAARHFGALRNLNVPLEGLQLPHPAARELMRLWRSLHWTSGDGMMTPQERLAIYRLACGCPAAGDFVELGAWKGLTTCYLAAACRARRSGRVFAVDTFAGTREHDTRYAAIDHYGGSTLAAFRALANRTGLAELITPCVGLTTDVVKRHAGRRLAFLLIDADHSYAGVKADFEAWSPLVVPGGLIVFHDYAMPDAGVRDYVRSEVLPRKDMKPGPGEVTPNVFAVTRA
jgi:predicted O-methyltransferase YrrM